MFIGYKLNSASLLRTSHLLTISDRSVGQHVLRYLSCQSFNHVNYVHLPKMSYSVQKSSNLRKTIVFNYPTAAHSTLNCVTHLKYEEKKPFQDIFVLRTGWYLPDACMNSFNTSYGVF